jgi:hypothetical protein
MVQNEEQLRKTLHAISGEIFDLCSSRSLKTYQRAGARLPCRLCEIFSWFL